LKAIAEANYYKTLTIQGPHIEPNDVHLGLHNTRPEVVSKSFGGLLGHMNLPQHPQNSSIFSAHNKFIVRVSSYFRLIALIK
jgi:hypothetical protein